MTMTGEPAPVGPLPEIPNELSGIWAYIKWEEAGCPNRTQEETDREYKAGITEMKELLQEGVSLDQLWKARDSGLSALAFATAARASSSLCARSARGYSSLVSPALVQPFLQRSPCIRQSCQRVLIDDGLR